MNILIILFRCPSDGSNLRNSEKSGHIPWRYSATQIRPRNTDHALLKKLYRSRARTDRCIAGCWQRTSRTSHVRKRYAHLHCNGYSPSGVPIHSSYVLHGDIVCTVIFLNGAERFYVRYVRQDIWSCMEGKLPCKAISIRFGKIFSSSATACISMITSSVLCMLIVF